MTSRCEATAHSMKKELSSVFESPPSLPFIVPNFLGNAEVREMCSLATDVPDTRYTRWSSQGSRTPIIREFRREERVSAGTIVLKLTQQLETSLYEANRPGTLLEKFSPNNNLNSVEKRYPSFRHTPQLQVHIPKSTRPDRKLPHLTARSSEFATLSCESLPKPLHARSPVPRSQSALSSHPDLAPPSICVDKCNGTGFVITVR